MADFGGLHADDPDDKALLARVHPSDWVNPRAQGRYNLVVVGAGTAGLVSAAGAAGLGARVALVERALMGGDCLNYGCVPSKALLRAAHAIADVRRANRFGVRLSGDPDIDFRTVMSRMRRVRATMAPNDSAQRFAGLGVDVHLGDARFIDGETIEVAGQRLRFARAVIATGARPTLPAVPGLAEDGVLTNETFFGLTRLPPRLLVIGAGPIGCEIAQAFARFGSHVTIVSLDDRLLPREDPDVSALLRTQFEAEGISLHLGATLTRVTSTAQGKQVTFERGQGEESVTTDEILVAVGRRANVDDLNLAAAGVVVNAAGVQVDDWLRTTNRRIYAAGDVCSPYKFTHAADAMARVVIQNALFAGRKRASSLVIPWCTYTDPEIAHVGLSEREARDRGLDVQTVSIPFSEVDRAIVDDQADGFARLHVNRRGVILGSTIVARRAGEMMAEVTLAMTQGLKASALSEAIHPYPTETDVMRRLGDAYRRSRLTPLVRRLLERYFTWRR